MGIFEQYQARAMRHAKENVREGELQDRAEPIVSRLKSGKNYLTPKQFRDVAEYLLAVPGQNWGETPFKAGRFVVGAIEVIRVKWPNKDRQLSALQLSRMVGVTKQHMLRLLNEAEIPFTLDGNKRLYDFGVLELFRDRLKESA
jgi:hypothetical protein